MPVRMQRCARALFFLLVTMQSLGAAAREQVLFYKSGELKIKAHVFAPIGFGPFPVVLFNHGGISGLVENGKRRCMELAAKGYLVFASAYRGEDGSDGQIEVALGEVDDVLAGLAFLKQDPRADLNRVALLGFSHGALISLQAAKRRPNIRALVFAYGVADLYAWHAYLVKTDQLGHDAITSRVYGTGPASRPREFAARNGMSNLAAIDPELPVLIVQGGKDVIVPPTQGATLEAELKQHTPNTRLLVYPRSAHAFLIVKDQLKGQQRREADAAWLAIERFLARHLRK